MRDQLRASRPGAAREHGTIGTVVETELDIGHRVAPQPQRSKVTRVRRPSTVIATTANLRPAP